ncbi:helix-turn-helix domain-containing protein [Candidatus Venteria ishoeyi]|uniref:AAA family ATPase n=1 Tax=Candidatus Venteria ishoeyi TaxID=1899563 RepID=UPI0025A5529D|nr:AAA family ATPase [Candidatus Venteria ishoeyi]MDM8547410.1 helix-turn-helix domain-containing protein [Candidatus Venteria ishoeyi]
MTKANTQGFAELLIQAMSQADINVSEMARRIDLSRHTLLHWRSGKTKRPNCEKVLLCAQQLNLPTYEARQLLAAAGCDFTQASEKLSVSTQNADPFDLPPEKLSPFVIGQPVVHPRQFYGRKALVSRIIRIWQRHPLQNIAITGERRIGKSSLLHYLKAIAVQRVSVDFKVVLIDFKETRMRSQTSLLQFLLQALGLPVLSNCSLINFEELLSHHVLCHPTVVLLDDIEYGLASDSLSQEFWWAMRSVQHNYCQGRLGFLMTSRQKPAQLAQEVGKPSPFFNVFGYQVKLEGFTEEEALALISNVPTAFSNEVIKEILEQSQGKPDLLQQCCANHLSNLELDY